MSGDVAGYLTTGELARCAAVTVRTVRWYSDQGLLFPCCRSAAGYRLYDSETLARLELIRTLREIGPDLPVIKKVLAREVNLADVAAAHADALESQIRARYGCVTPCCGRCPLRGSQPGYRGRPRRVGRPQSRPRRWAIAAASTRPAAPSLARMLETWTLAVLGLMNNT